MGKLGNRLQAMMDEENMESRNVKVEQLGHLADNVESKTLYGEQKTPHLTDIHMDDGKWTREQTQVLINTWKESKHILLSSTASSTQQFKAWKLILKEVNKLSPPKSLQQCKKKFRNIRYICKNAMNNNKQAGTKRHYPLFYLDFVEIIGDCERAKRGLNTPSGLEMFSDFGDGCSSDYLPKDDAHHFITDSHTNTPADENRSICPPMVISPSHTSATQYIHNRYGNGEHTSSNGDNIETGGHRHCISRSPPRDCFRSNVNSDNREIDLKNGATSLSDVTSLSPSYESSALIHGENYYVDNLNHSLPKRAPKRAIINSSPSNVKSNQMIARRTDPNVDFYPTMVATSTIFDVRTTSADIITSVSSRHVRTEQSEKSPIFSFTDINKQNNNNKTSDSRPTHHVPSPIYIPMRENNTTSHVAPSFEERFLSVQERQIELFNGMLHRHEQFLLRLLSQQREAAEAAQSRDREFMIKLTELFLQQKP